MQPLLRLLVFGLSFCLAVNGWARTARLELEIEMTHSTISTSFYDTLIVAGEGIHKVNRLTRAFNHQKFGFDLPSTGMYRIYLKTVTGYTYSKEVEIKKLKTYEVYIPLQDVFTIVGKEEILFSQLREGDDTMAFLETEIDEHVPSDNTSDYIFFIQRNGTFLVHSFCYNSDDAGRWEFENLNAISLLEDFERRGKQLQEDCYPDNDIASVYNKKVVIILGNRMRPCLNFFNNALDIE
ncbi:hypothetical protein SAMN05421823_1231 [Catalinimonas alkaloidigena]|uniref:Uncharacterized protein n=1 Tax=Catalinimonas alkaloidigena TaxID=1075417 RepID=A0A1G9VQD7_9BACT|nr:hypothetical protein [Catalinimonas alkaloidigena]SDM74340.1 hypothetical protein SAMN05421823_1231 [Catalinimonas alkaloidigena]